MRLSGEEFANEVWDRLEHVPHMIRVVDHDGKHFPVTGCALECLPDGTLIPTIQIDENKPEE